MLIRSRSFSEVVAAFFGSEGVEERADAPPCCFMGSLGSLPHEVFEFGEDLLDRVQVGAVWGQERSLAPTARIALRMAGFLWLDRLSMMTTSPGERVGTRHCST